MKNNNAVIYFGFNNPKSYKRGVENVILMQSQSIKYIKKYYFFFGDVNNCFKWGDITCFSLKNTFFKYIKLNLLVFLLKRKHENVIVHSHSYLFSFFCLYRTTIFTVHDGLFYLKNEMGSKLLFVFKIIEKIVYKRSKLIHFISKYSYQMSLISKTNSNIVFVNNTSSILNDPILNQTLENTEEFFLVVRSIEERANIDLIIELALRFTKEGNENLIKIAGKGPLLMHYRNLIKNLSLTNIEFLGYVDDVYLKNLYECSKAVIVPALYGEGFGLPIVEAYAFGKPVIASNVCAMPSIIIDKSFLFENNIESLYDKVQLLLNSTIDKEYIKEYFYEKYSEKIILKEYRDLYSKYLILKN